MSTRRWHAALLLLLGAAGSLFLLLRAPLRHGNPPGEPAHPLAPPPEVRISGDGPRGSAFLRGGVTRGGAPAAARVEVRRSGEHIDESSPWISGGPVGEGPALASLATSTDGRFIVREIPPGRYEVLAAAEDGARGVARFDIEIDGLAVAVDVEIPAGRLTLAGRAVHPDGLPFAGRVALEGESGPPDVACDAEGRFAFSGLSPGEVVLVASIPGVLVATSPPVRLPRDGEVLFVVGAGPRTVSGCVLAGPEGGPIPGATVTATAWRTIGTFRAETRADATGRFEFSIPPGEGDLAASAEGFTTGRVPLPPPGREAEIMLLRPARLEGVVVSAEDRAPVPGVPVTLKSPGADEPTTRTDAAGRFEFRDVPHGEVTVLAWGGGWLPAEAGESADFGVWQRAVHLSPGERRSMEVRVRRAAGVRGLVLDARGDPVAGARVVAEVQARFGWWFWWDAPEGAGVATNAEGRFEYASLVPGARYAFAACAPGLPAGFSGTLVATAEGTQEVTIRLPPDRWVEVTFLDAGSDAPMPGVRAAAVGIGPDGHWAWSSGARAISGADGRARLGPLPPGPIAVEAGHDDYAPLRAPLPAPLSAGTGDLTAVVRLSRYLGIRGRVVLPDGSSAGDGEVQATSDSEILAGFRPAWTRAAVEGGAFHLRGVARGLNRIECTVVLAGRTFSGRAKAGAGSADVEVPLRDLAEAGPGEVAVAVLLDPSGRPVPLAEVDDASAGPPSPRFGMRVSARGEILFSELWGEVCWILVRHARSADGEPLGAALVGPLRVGDPPREVRLAPALAVEGTARTTDGTPLAGVRLRALRPLPKEAAGRRWSWSEGNTCQGSLDETVSDAEGRFRLGGLGEGEVRIETVVPGRFRGSPEITARAGQSGLAVVVPGGRAVRLTVLDPDDRPVAGVEVSAFRSTREDSITDGHGGAALRGLDPEAEYLLTVDPTDARPDLRTRRRFPWRPMDEVIRLDGSLPVAGVVRDPDGRPVGDAEVRVRLPDDGEKLTWTRDDGSFILWGLDEGTVRLSVSLPESSLAESGIEDLPVVTGMRDLALTIRPVRDLVVVLEGSVCAPCDLYLTRLPVSDRSPWRQVSAGVPGVTTFRVDAEADYVVFARAAREGLCAARWGVREDAGRIVLGLAPGLTLRGRIVLPPGTTGAGRADVTVRGAGFCVHEEVRDDLTLEVGGLPDQELEVSASVSFDLRSREPLRARPGDTLVIELR